MTQVDFHSGVADKLGYACRLLRKAYRSGSPVMVAGAPELLARLDNLLWTFDPGDFIPHLRLRAGDQVPDRLACTPIWLVEAVASVPAERASPAVLVNLGPGVVQGFERFARVIELVAEADEEVADGRRRWRHYQDAGLAPANHAQRAA